MKQRMTGLESMRWARQNREAQTVDALLAYCGGIEDALFRARITNRTLNDKVDVLQTTLMSDFAKNVFEQMKADIADLYRAEIEKALGAEKIVSISLNPVHLRFFQKPTEDLLAQLAGHMKQPTVFGTIDQGGTQRLRIVVEKVTADRVVREEI